MVGSPLLPFLLDAILQYSNPVESHSANHRFGEAGAYIHCLHAGDVLHRLHEVSCKMFAQKILIYHFNRERRLLGLTLLVRFRHHNIRQKHALD